MVIVVTQPSNGICTNTEGKRFYTHGDEGNSVCSDENNFDTNYGYISFLIDNGYLKTNSPKTKISSVHKKLIFNCINGIETKKAIGPFSYAFTADGKLIAGNKVEEWRAKEL